MITYHIPVRVRSRANERLCWQAKARRDRAEKEAAYLATKANIGILTCKIEGVRMDFERPIVTLIYLIPTRGKAIPDGDNLQGMLKYVRDGVALGLFGPQGKRGAAPDEDWRITWRYAQERGEGGVRVEVSP